jgi:hypothetical protein
MTERIQYPRFGLTFLLRSLSLYRSDGEVLMATGFMAPPRDSAVGKFWWVLLVTGILWILIGIFVLQAHYT